MNILLVAPRTPSTFWGYRHALRFVRRKSLLPPLGLLTVAGMLPKHWNLRLVDMNTAPLSDRQIRWADYVFTSAMLIEAESVREILSRCRALAVPVVCGGPLFTTGRSMFPGADCCVMGEAEPVVQDLVRDLESGTLKTTYACEQRPSLSETPIPRWDLISLNAYLLMPIQFSRGCPFDCEFCDITVMYGRRPRTKSPERFIAELDALVDAGWKGPVFIVDDNFIGNKKCATQLLEALVAWRAGRGARTTFTTEASLNLAVSPRLLSLMARAGFKQVFVGIETPSEASLNECGKTQNLRRDMAWSVRRIQRAGIEVLGGFILGFDNDTVDIFERQRRFIQQSGIVTAMVGLLTALPKTRLYERLADEGRLLRESTGNNLDAVLNYIPSLDRKVLVDGYRELVKNLYTPREFYARAEVFLRQYRPRGPKPQVSLGDVAAALRAFWVLGVREKGRRAFWRFVSRTATRHRRALVVAINMAIRGHHFRAVARDL